MLSEGYTIRQRGGSGGERGYDIADWRTIDILQLLVINPVFCTV